MLIVWLWTVASVAGGCFSMWNMQDAGKDRLALKLRNQNGSAIDAAKYLQRTEILRGLQFLLLAVVGILALLSPFFSREAQKNVGEALGWTLLAHVVLLAANSAQSTFYRRKITKEAP